MENQDKKEQNTNPDELHRDLEEAAATVLDEVLSEVLDQENQLDDEADDAEKPTSDGDTAAKPPVSFAMLLYDWVEILVVAITLVILVFNFVGRVATVDGTSMLPTLKHGERLLIQQAFYEPKQGDIIICQSAKYGMGEPLVKRIIALGGQTITVNFDTWQVFVDGVELEEDYINFNPEVPMNGWDYGASYTVPEGYVFVMGDNRNNSQDSRRHGVGPIDERLIVGKAIIGFTADDGVVVFD